MDGKKIIEGSKESVDEFIIRLSHQVNGVGSAKAGSLAEDFGGDLQGFLNADFARLSKLKRSNGEAVLTPEQINELIALIQFYPKGKSIQETWVFHLGREFLKGQVAMVEALHFGDFDINPLLAKALNLDTPRKIIAFNVYQSVTRSVVTSWGYTVQNIAKFVGCKDDDYIIEGKTGTKFDLVKDLKGVNHHIQVKSGPNDMNVGMVVSLNEAIKKLEKGKPGAVGMLGITYGTRKSISNQISGNLKGANKRIWVGRELWDIISEKEDFHKDLFKLLDQSTKGILNKSLIELIEDKIDELEKFWLAHYPKLSIDEVLEKYI